MSNGTPTEIGERPAYGRQFKDPTPSLDSLATT
jgi:hypothetical protein